MKKIIFSLLFVGLLVPVVGLAASPVVPYGPCAPGHLFSYLTGQKCPTIDPVPSAYCVSNLLTIGSTGSQVIELQTKLVNDGFLIMPFGVAKGYFGNLTAQALAKAQNKFCTRTDYGKPTVKVISPNGGEKWVPESVENIKWEHVYTACLNVSPCAALPSSDFDKRKVDINLIPKDPCPPVPANGEYVSCLAIRPPDIVLDKNVSRSNNSYGWIVATDINDDPIPADKYKIQICVAGSTTDCDLSDQYFEIVN